MCVSVSMCMDRSRDLSTHMDTQPDYGYKPRRKRKKGNKTENTQKQYTYTWKKKKKNRIQISPLTYGPFRLRLDGQRALKPLGITFKYLILEFVCLFVCLLVCGIVFYTPIRPTNTQHNQLVQNQYHTLQQPPTTYLYELTIIKQHVQWKNQL